MDTFLLVKIVTELIMPPGAIVLVLLAALLVWRWRPWLAAVLVTLALVALYAVSTPYVAGRLANRVEIHPAIVPGSESSALDGVGAIVVLGGGRRLHAPEFGGATVSSHALERLRYAARLARASGIPLAVTGGAVFSPGPSEGELMAQTLERDFAVRARWVESRSRNTAENARYVARLLAADGVTRIALVSHASHLYRAVEMFTDAGFDVVPAPAAFLGDPKPELILPGDFLPTARALRLTRLVLHELVGRLWYRLRRPG